MKNNQLDTVAKSIGVSASAVSKAINHCHGIGTELREQILAEAEKQGVSGKDIRHLDCYAIIPETPSYFWKHVFNSLVKELRARNIVTKFNVYSKIGDDAVVLRYLDEATDLNAKLVIIASDNTVIDARLEKMAEERAVFALLEPTNVKNVFYFGSDRLADSRILAEKCLSENPDIKNILVIGKDSLRRQGFCEAICDVDTNCVYIPSELPVSELARQIDEIYRKSPFDAVACLDGITSKICIALKKCRIAVPRYGFENQPTEGRYELPGGDICQNIEKIAAEAASAAEKYLKYSIYPDKKINIVPSDYSRVNI